MTRFAEWLEEELRGRAVSRAQLAAYMGKRPQTVYSWFNDDRIPSSAMCQEIARVLHLPIEEVLRAAGHLPAEPSPAEPELPGWLRAVLLELDSSELRVVDATARGLLALREEKAAFEASPPPPTEPAPPRSPQEPPSTE